MKVDPKSIKISNKLGWKRIPKSNNGIINCEPGVWVNLEYDAVLDISYQGILDCYHQGNELVAPYHVDIVSVHDPDEYITMGLNENEMNIKKKDVLEAYRALIELKQQGLVESIGVGSKDPKTIEYISNNCILDWVMLACHLTLYTHTEYVIELLHTLTKKNIHIINAAVFNSGFLIGEEFYDYMKILKKDHLILFEWRDNFNKSCKELNLIPAHVCIQYSYLYPEIHTIALNATSIEQVKNNNSMVNTPLSMTIWEKLLYNKVISHIPTCD